jgi:hypothetical protein
VISETLSRANIDSGSIDTVVIGQVVQAGAKMNPARQAAIKAGIPVSVPAMTINRVCGLGAQAIATAAQEIMLGFAQSAVAGGMENMDQSPYLMAGGRLGYRMGDAKIFDSMLRDGLNDAFCDQHSGLVTEDLVTEFQVTRDAQDCWALRTQQRFGTAQAAGKFDPEIAPVEVPARKGAIVFGKDENKRPGYYPRRACQAEAGISQGRHDYGRECASPQQRSSRHDRRGSRMGREGRGTDGAPGRLRCRCGRAGHVRARAGAGGAPSLGAGEMEARRHRAHRDQ